MKPGIEPDADCRPNEDSERNVKLVRDCWIIRLRSVAIWRSSRIRSSIN